MENQKTRPVCCFLFSLPNENNHFRFSRARFAFFCPIFNFRFFFENTFFFFFERIPRTPWPSVVHTPYTSTVHRESNQQQTKRRVAICEPVPSDYTPFRWLVCLVWLVGWLVRTSYCARSSGQQNKDRCIH